MPPHLAGALVIFSAFPSRQRLRNSGNLSIDAILPWRKSIVRVQAIGPHPWSPPPRMPKIGDQSPSRLYQKIGWALTEWEELEFWCTHLFLALHPRENGHFQYDLLSDYEACPNFPGRTELIKKRHAVLRCNQENERELDDLLGQAREYSARRNDIAHGVVRKQVRRENMQIEGTKKRLPFVFGQERSRYPEDATITEFGFFLVPVANLKKRASPSAERKFVYYNTNEVWHYGVEFSRLGHKIRTFICKVDPSASLPPPWPPKFLWL